MYIPETHEVRDVWADDQFARFDVFDVRESYEGFDRWLNEVKAEAWWEAASCAPEYMPANPYRMP